MMPDPMLDLLRRDERETTFDSSCKITAPGEGFHDDDGVWHPPESGPIYEGPCSFLPQQAATRSVEYVGQQVEIYPFQIKVPANTPVRRGHVVEITACPDEAGPGFYTVRAAPPSQWQVNRVLGCEQGVA